VFAIAGIVHLNVAAAGAEADVDALHRTLSEFGYPEIETRTHAGASFAVAREPWAAACRKSVSLAVVGTRMAMVNGRLDNRADLETATGRPQDASPATVVADTHGRWGEAAPVRWLGDFAVAVWDARDRRLHLVRDSGGWHALYHLRLGDRVLFADALPVLVALAPGARRLDPQVLADVLVDGTPPVDRTVWRDIHAVPPASGVRIDADACAVRPYWQLPRAELHMHRDGDYVEAARALLDEAVRCRLPAAGPAGIALSGGLDSAGLAATMAAAAPGATLHGFTAVPAPGAPIARSPCHYDDERPYVGMLGERLPTLRASCASLAPDAEDGIDAAVLRLAGMPLNNSLNAAWLSPAHEAAADRGVATVLTGGFGNITLSYDGMALLPALFDRGALGALAVEVAALSRRGPRGAREITRAALAESRWLKGFRDIHRDPTLWPKRRLGSSYVAPAFADGVGWVRYQVDGAAAVPTGGTGDRPWHVARSQRQRHLHMPLARHWRTELAQPLADRRLVEFCLSVPLRQFLRHGETRSLARRVLADRLPAAILDNRLRGRQCPEAVHLVSVQASRLLVEVDGFAGSPLVRHCLDVDRIRRGLARIRAAAPDEIGFAAHLHRAVQHARFLAYLDRLGGTL